VFWNKLVSQLSIHVNQGVDKRHRATGLLYVRSTCFCALAYVFRWSRFPFSLRPPHTPGWNRSSNHCANSDSLQTDIDLFMWNLLLGMKTTKTIFHSVCMQCRIRTKRKYTNRTASHRAAVYFYFLRV
jgi:hypothetical protein